MLDGARILPQADHKMSVNEFRGFVGRFAAAQSFFTVTMFRHTNQGYNVVFKGQGGVPVVRVAIVGIGSHNIESTWVASDVIAVKLTERGQYSSDVARVVEQALDNTLGSVLLSVRCGVVFCATFLQGNILP